MEIPMSFDRWERMPRHPDWKYEYFDGAAQLSYRPKPLHVRRPTDMPVILTREHDVRLLHAPDDGVRAFLAELWRAEDPFRMVDDPGEWVDEHLARSLGRLAEPVGAVAVEGGEIIGAVLVEQPHRDETAPNLTWLSVRSGFRCDGVGTALLAATVPALRAADVPDLDSHASVGDRASVAWHWRNGFAALPDPMAGYSWDARRQDG